jgi:hypothetical protein
VNDQQREQLPLHEQAELWIRRRSALVKARNEALYGNDAVQYREHDSLINPQELTEPLRSEVLRQLASAQR